MIAGRGAGERGRSGHQLATIAAEVGTPFYAYDLDRFRERIRAFEEALAEVPHLTSYAAKANDALAVLRVVAAEGLGADVVSGGELAKCLSAGISPEGIVFSGVGKREDEIRAAVEAGIRSLNVESLEELDEIASAATSLGRVAPIAVRLNPDVAGGGHEYLTTGGAASKFGLERAEAMEAFRRAAEEEALEPVGLSFHIGSQLLDAEPVFEAAARAAGRSREHRLGVEQLGTNVEGEPDGLERRFGRRPTEGFHRLGPPEAELARGASGREVFVAAAGDIGVQPDRDRRDASK